MIVWIGVGMGLIELGIGLIELGIGLIEFGKGLIELRIGRMELGIGLRINNARRTVLARVSGLVYSCLLKHVSKYLLICRNQPHLTDHA